MVLSLQGFSQNTVLGNWLVYIGNKEINSRLNVHHEIQYRNYNLLGDKEQFLARTGVGYNLSENNNNLLLGYAYIQSNNYQGERQRIRSEEHRIYQQFITKQVFGRSYWWHRYRFEQRFADDFKMRLRYFLNVRVPLNSTKLDPGTFFLSGYNELFMNVKKDTAFDRNRLYGGMGYQVNSFIKLELGYMNQFLASTNRDQLNVFMFAKF